MARVRISDLQKEIADLKKLVEYERARGDAAVAACDRVSKEFAYRTISVGDAALVIEGLALGAREVTYNDGQKEAGMAVERFRLMALVNLIRRSH